MGGSQIEGCTELIESDEEDEESEEGIHEFQNCTSREL